MHPELELFLLRKVVIRGNSNVLFNFLFLFKQTKRSGNGLVFGPGFEESDDLFIFKMTDSMTALEEGKRGCGLVRIYIHLNVKIIGNIKGNPCCNSAVVQNDFVLLPVHIDVFEVFLLNRNMRGISVIFAVLGVYVLLNPRIIAVVEDNTNPKHFKDFFDMEPDFL